MKIQQQDDGKKGIFFVETNKNIVAQMTYTWTGETKIIIDHTEVDETLEGKGVGRQLVEEAVQFAREKRIKILPLCSFAKHVFDTCLDFNDVL